MVSNELEEEREQSPASACQRAASAAVATAVGCGISLPPETSEKLARFCAEIVDVSSHTNVTALRTPEAMGQGLFLESLSILPALESYVSGNPRVVDVGSGAGIPGIPLAIARSLWSFVLLESIEKKAAFLRRAAERLGLHQVAVVSERAETFGVETGRDHFDLAVARAVAPLPILLEWCGPLVRPGGYLALSKGAGVENEIAASIQAAKALRIEWVDTLWTADEMGLGPARCTVMYRKVASTPAGFPRRIGLAKTHPIGVAHSKPAIVRERRPRQE